MRASEVESRKSDVLGGDGVAAAAGVVTMVSPQVRENVALANWFPCGQFVLDKCSVTGKKPSQAMISAPAGYGSGQKMGWDCRLQAYQGLAILLWMPNGLRYIYKQ